ncbi:hypothetical protein MRX96_009828 [Rhipicephalus microplus]
MMSRKIEDDVGCLRGIPLNGSPAQFGQFQATCTAAHFMVCPGARFLSNALLTDPFTKVAAAARNANAFQWIQSWSCAVDRGESTRWKKDRYEIEDLALQFHNWNVNKVVTGAQLNTDYLTNYFQLRH